jgi:hypothetical protein
MSGWDFCPAVIICRRQLAWPAGPIPGRYFCVFFHLPQFERVKIP